MNAFRTPVRGPSTLAMLLGVAFLLCGDAAYATDNDSGSWNIFSTTDAFRKDGEETRWRYWFDAQARYFDIGSGSNQWVARPAIGYSLYKNVNAWFGYGRFRARSASGDVVDEDRAWQQVDWGAGRFRGGSLSMRVRFEQRWLSSGDDVGVVLRYRAQYVKPLGKAGRTTLNIGLEPFFDLRDTDWGARAGLSQGRIHVLVGHPIGDRLAVDVGYMNQFFLRERAENRSIHHLVLGVRLKL